MWLCSYCFETNENDKDVCKHCQKKKDTSGKGKDNLRKRMTWYDKDHTQQTTKDIETQSKEPLKAQCQHDEEPLYEGTSWKAIQSFDGKTTDGPRKQLAFNEGDIIVILDTSDKEWWRGQLGEVKGRFPAHYITKSDIGVHTEQPIEYQVQEDDDPPYNEMLDRFYQVLISFKSTSPYAEDNLDVKVGDNVLFLEKSDGWFWVRHGDDEGWIPSDHVKLISTNKTEDYDSENNYGVVDSSDFEPFATDQSDNETDYEEISSDQSDNEPDYDEIGPGIFKLHSCLESIDETEYQEQLRIVMVGKTGSGKSASGNSLLGRKHFVSKIGGQSVTKVCSRGETVYEGRKIVVIDTPGLFDTKLSPEQIRENIVSCIHMSLPGPHVFLLVLQIGRFTEEEIAAFNHLFEIFGQSMGKCTIILLTGLDSLERESKTVESYIEETGESIQKYIKNCGSRYFAIDNVASPGRKENTRKNLLDKIDEMLKQNNGNFFSNALFTNAENHINEALKEVKQKEEITHSEEVVKIKHDFDEKINVIKDEKEVLKQDLCLQDERKKQLVQQREETEADICRLRFDFNISPEKQQVLSLKTEELQKKKARIVEEENEVYESLHSLRIQQMELEDDYADIKSTQLTGILQVERDYKRRLSEAIEKATEDSCKMMNSMWEKVEEVENKLKEVSTQLDDESNRDNKQFRTLLATQQKNLTKQRHKLIRKQSKYFRQVMQKSAFLEREFNEKKKMCIVM